MPNQATSRHKSPEAFVSRQDDEIDGAIPRIENDQAAETDAVKDNFVSVRSSLAQQHIEREAECHRCERQRQHVRMIIREQEAELRKLVDDFLTRAVEVEVIEDTRASEPPPVLPILKIEYARRRRWIERHTL